MLKTQLTILAGDRDRLLGIGRNCSNSKFKILGGVRCQGRGSIGEHEINQMLPTGEQEILGEAENVLEKPFASAALATNLLIGRVNQLQYGMKQEGEQIEGEQERG